MSPVSLANMAKVTILTFSLTLIWPLTSQKNQDFLNKRSLRVFDCLLRYHPTVTGLQLQSQLQSTVYSYSHWLASEMEGGGGVSAPARVMGSAENPRRALVSPRLFLFRHLRQWERPTYVSILRVLGFSWENSEMLLKRTGDLWCSFQPKSIFAQVIRDKIQFFAKTGFV